MNFIDKYIDCFQIVSLGALVFTLAGKMLYFRFFKNINPIVIGSGKKGLERVIELALFLGFVVWLVEIFLYALNSPAKIFPAALHIKLIDNVPLKIIGVLLILIGFALFFWALFSFRDSWRIGIDVKTPGELVTTGAFAVSRNPIYVFLDLYAMGTCLINGALFFLLAAALMIVGSHYQVLKEEQFLAKNYGQAYMDYCATRNRYFGRKRK